MLQVLDIIPGTSVDGPGLRTSIYLAGCHHHCQGCHNPQSWDPTGGTAITVDELMERIRLEGFNVTLTGGDPAYQATALLEPVRRMRQEGFTVWFYTGFTFGQLAQVPGMAELLPMIEVVVDGPFVEELRDVNLRFRGSSNQRLVDVAKSIESGHVVEWSD